DAALVAAHPEDAHTEFAVRILRVVTRNGARRHAPDRVAEHLAGVALLHPDVPLVVRAEALRSEPPLVDDERGHQRLEHAAAPGGHVPFALPLVEARVERSALGLLPAEAARHQGLTGTGRRVHPARLTTPGDRGAPPPR